MYLVKIIRKTSPYNKYIKWFAEGVSEETGATFSLGFKTRRQAEEHGWRAGRVIEVRTKNSVLKNPAYR